VTGGISIFADSFRAATLLRLNSPMLFRTLTKFPVSYHYRNDGHHYHLMRPTIVLDEMYTRQIPHAAACLELNLLDRLKEPAECRCRELLRQRPAVYTQALSPSPDSA